MQLDGYDFIDFGAGIGDSLARFEERFGGRGIGIEVDEEKVRKARELGRDVVIGDLFNVPEDSVRFVAMDNVLEHLPSLEAVEDILRQAARVATEFLYIRHPSFEDEAYLAAIGLKLYWTEWTGHTCHIMLSDFAAMFRRLGLGMAEIRYNDPAFDSSNANILPASAPPDQSGYDEIVHGSKPVVAFDRPVYGSIDLLIPLVGNTVNLEDDAEDSRPRLGHPTSWEESEAELESLRSRRSIRAANAMARARRARSWRELRAALREFGRSMRRSR